ncbi:histidine--tRNA ligase [Adlercreutzia sp. ZJ304]|uniref:histidine--tRNA ligase n=1 Tax=Adlercreutzia sp. ZJ304 TaxID=2709791 RepID=UPI0013EAEEE9|nr:histidine--tRNA ligase [Adlercreutzia sp. ZJ304]
MAIKAPEGTRDLLPDEALFWEQFKRSATDVFGRCGYVLIDTPIMEQTELFVRGIGQATDVVSKEMFTAISGENLKTLLDGGTIKAKSRLSLRPEGTAGVVRAVVQHDLVPQGAPPVKLMYAGPMFRAERPQKGRQRQFNQIGIECLGANDSAVDAEAIVMCMRFFAEVGIPADNMRLLLNSMGCEKCRPTYREMVREYMEQHSDELCDTCMTRAEVNPLRAFDCKNEACATVMENAPKITDHLCDECQEHYAQVKDLLDSAGVQYVEDASLVRGLDYYTRTVFEVQVIDGMGSQNAIGGGGRYDKLAEEVGGRATPGFGFALGYERCVLALQAAGMEFPAAQHCDLFVACVDSSARAAAFALSQACRDSGFACQMDYQQRSLKSQFKLADKLCARFVAVLGPDELAAGVANLRDMHTHEEQQVILSEIPSKLSV